MVQFFGPATVGRGMLQHSMLMHKHNHRYAMGTWHIIERPLTLAASPNILHATWNLCFAYLLNPQKWEGCIWIKRLQTCHKSSKVALSLFSQWDYVCMRGNHGQAQLGSEECECWPAGNWGGGTIELGRVRAGPNTQYYTSSSNYNRIQSVGFGYMEKNAELFCDSQHSRRATKN